jgi:pimeloyl-ACP methyl ester carboxylesterase
MPILEAVIPIATVVVTPRAGHAPQIEAAQAFTSIVERFLVASEK